MSARVTIGVYLAATLVLQAAAMPRMRDMRLFAFEDPGAALRTHSMLERGLIPTVDFNYFYGPASVSLSRAWFGALGATPEAFLVLIALLGLVVAWGLARCAIAWKWPVLPRLFLLAVLPLIVNPTEPNFVHALERAALLHGLAFQARGQRRLALGLAVIAGCHKPSVAVVYALTLIGWELLDCFRGIRSARHALGSLALAVGLGSLLALPAVLQYGVQPAVAMQFPLKAAATYRLSNMGFFGPEGRLLWDPAGRAVTYYLGSGVGLWLASVAITIVAGLAALPAVVRRNGGPSGESSVTLMLLQLGALAAFANCWSWTYFSAVSFLGLGDALARIEGRTLRWGRFLAGGALIAGIVGCYTQAMGARIAWREARPLDENPRHVLPASVLEEWRSVRSRLDGDFVVLSDGEARLLDDRAIVPDVWFFIWARAWTPREQAEAVRSLDSRPVLLTAHEPRYADLWLKHPAIEAALARRPLLFEGRYFTLLGPPEPARP